MAIEVWILVVKQYLFYMYQFVFEDLVLKMNLNHSYSLLNSWWKLTAKAQQTFTSP